MVQFDVGAILRFHRENFFVSFFLQFFVFFILFYSYITTDHIAT